MMPGEGVSATHRYIFMMKLSAQSSPKATREGEEERRVIETRALLSGPFLPTTRRQAEKEKKRASDRRRRKKRGHRCKWSVKQKIEETAAIPRWTTRTQRKGDKRNLDCLVRSRSPFTCCLSCAHTHTHTQTDAHVQTRAGSLTLIGKQHVWGTSDQGENHFGGHPSGHVVDAGGRGDRPLGRPQPTCREIQRHLWGSPLWPVEALQEDHLHGAWRPSGQRLWPHRPTWRYGTWCKNAKSLDAYSRWKCVTEPLIVFSAKRVTLKLV